MEKIDREFIRCCMEEARDGNAVTIVVATQELADAYALCFSEEELESITIVVGDPYAAANTGKIFAGTGVVDAAGVPRRKRGTKVGQ